MVAEEQQVCTICGVPVKWHQGVPLHTIEGRLELRLFTPWPHEATTEPQPTE